MPPPASLRPVVPEDREFLFQVYASTRTEELAVVPWTPEQKEAFLRMQFEAQDRYYRQQFPDASFQVVLVDGRPAGRLYLARATDEIRIIDIALLPADRGRGVGTGLLRDVLAEGASAGKPVRIHVERFNPAIRLYERLGFVMAEDKGVYLLMEWSARRAA